MEKFDLERALAGEPVKLKNGRKAYILGKVKDPNVKYCLIGYIAGSGANTTPESWDLTGGAGINFAYRDICIVGMWEEPKRFINGIEVPAPITEETWKDGEEYWHVDFGEYDCVDNSVFFKNSDYDAKVVSQGLVFETEEGAKAMAKALMSYKVEVAS